jgi:hypothetical protein
MKIVIDLDDMVVDDYWGETVTDRIKQIVMDETTKIVRKQVKAELKKSEKAISDFVKAATDIKIKETLKSLNLT